MSSNDAQSETTTSRRFEPKLVLGSLVVGVATWFGILLGTAPTEAMIIHLPDQPTLLGIWEDDQWIVFRRDKKALDKSEIWFVNLKSEQVVAPWEVIGYPDIVKRLPSGRYFAFDARHGSSFFDMKTGKSKSAPLPVGSRNWYHTISTDSRKVLRTFSGSNQGYLTKLFDVRTGECLSSVELPDWDRDDPYPAVSDDLRLLAVGRQMTSTSDPNTKFEIEVLSLEDGEHVERFVVPELPRRYGMTQLSILPSGTVRAKFEKHYMNGRFLGMPRYFAARSTKPSKEPESEPNSLTGEAASHLPTLARVNGRLFRYVAGVPLGPEKTPKSATIEYHPRSKVERPISATCAALLGYLAGVTYFMIRLYWIKFSTPTAVA